MNPLQLVISHQNHGEVSAWLVITIVVLLLIWLWSVVVVAKTKTQDPFDRIVWLLVVLALNIVGTLLYFFFGTEDDGRTKADSEQELKRRANEGLL